MTDYKQYKFHITAFIDTLGYKNAFKKVCDNNCVTSKFSCSTKHSSTNQCALCIERQAVFFDKFSKLFKKIVIDIRNLLKKFNKDNNVNIKIVTFSDNFLFAMPLSSNRYEIINDQDLYAFLTTISAIELFILEKGFLTVGGIDIGPLYLSEEENMVFGKGLISAIEYMNHKSKLPRVYISDYIGTHCMQHDSDILQDYVQHDDNGFYLNIRNYLKLNSQNESKTSKRILKFIDTEIKNHNEISVTKKYLWIREYFESVTGVDRIDRYLKLIDTHPYLFDNTEEPNSIKIVKEQQQILNFQKQLYKYAFEKAIPLTYFDIVLMTT